MDIAYSKKYGRYISAKELDNNSCIENEMLCPACHTKVFKVQRSKNIHYLAHYKNKDKTRSDYEQCELRVFHLSEKVRKKGKKHKKHKGINKVILIGKMTDITENEFSEKDSSIAIILLTETDKTKEWHHIRTTKKKLNKLKPELLKDDQLYIEGRLNTRYWHDELGNKKELTEVIVTKIFQL